MVFLFAFIKILLYTNYGGFMKKVIYLNSNNVNLFYRKFRLYKFLSHFNINFIINYCGKEYTLNNKYPQKLGIILNMTDILNTRNKKEKYNKIYIKKGYYYRTGDVPYLKYFLSPRQKLIALTSHFKDKDENVNKMIKFYKLP